MGHLVKVHVPETPLAAATVAVALPHSIVWAKVGMESSVYAVLIVCALPPFISVPIFSLVFYLLVSIIRLVDSVEG